MSNLVVTPGVHGGGEDELAALREEQAAHVTTEGKPKEKDKAEDEDSGRGRSRSRKKDKKDKKKKKKKKKKAVKLEGQKEVGALFAKTGLDPDPEVRRVCRKRAAKVAKKKKDKSSGSSDDSSSDSSLVVQEGEKLFGGESTVMSIARRVPGALTCAAVEEVAENLGTMEGGLWNLQEGAVPPLFMRYFRQQLAPRMSPAMGREAQTLSQGLDFLLLGRPAAAVDLLAQRLKGLEMQSSGVHYSVAQQQEVLVKEAASMATTPEFREAARQAREEGKAKMEASRPFGARSSGYRNEDWGQGRGSGKKGGGKGKPGKNDGKKGDGGKRQDGKDKKDWVKVLLDRRKEWGGRMS